MTHLATLCSLAALAFIVACVSHEALGHGLACVGSGGAVTLLSSSLFQCRPGSPIVDLAGTLMNLAVAGIAALLLLRGRAASPAQTTFLGFVLAFSGLWGAGYFIFSALADTGDLAFAARDLALEPRWAWRAAMLVLGAWLYRKILRAAARHLPRGRPLVIAYAVAGAVAVLSVAFFPGPTALALREAAEESLLAPFGLLFIARQTVAPGQPVISGSRGIIALGVGVVVVFWVLLGGGMLHSKI